MKASYTFANSTLAGALMLGVLVSFAPSAPFSGVAYAVDAASITVSATKIVCTDEDDLPNWGVSESGFITSSTAADWVAAHDSCDFEAGWSFEWGNQEAIDPGGSFVGPAGANFTTFGTTDVNGVVTTTIPLSALGAGTDFHLREVLQAGFIPFTFDGDDDDTVSAEFYCASDVYHYDNFDFIRSPVADTTYYCVGWNVPVVNEEPSVPGCMNPEATNFNVLATVDDESCEFAPTPILGCTDSEANNFNPEATQNDDSCTYDNDDSPPPLVVDNPECSDGIDNDGDSRVDFPSDGSCFDAADDSESDSGGGGFGPPPSSGGGSSGSVLGASIGPVGQVLGESCGLYMDKHLRRGSAKNDRNQVTKLQTFLNKWMKSDLPLTGHFGPMTEVAVKAFQEKYGEGVLKPWNLSGSTGLVYLTTLRQINLLECPDLTLEIPPLVPWKGQ
jgi:peptidoglycan hydrolase-like protein with peptidoglycan-binding domain